MQRQHRILSLAGLAFASFVFTATDVACAVEARVIFRCKANGVVTFSDRPCDANAEAYELDGYADVQPHPPAEPSPKSSPREKSRASPKRPAANDQAKRARECERLNDAIRDIVRKMRSGYGVREGEKLRERKAQLEKQRRASRC